MSQSNYPKYTSRRAQLPILVNKAKYISSNPSSLSKSRLKSHSARAGQIAIIDVINKNYQTRPDSKNDFKSLNGTEYEFEEDGHDYMDHHPPSLNEFDYSGYAENKNYYKNNLKEHNSDKIYLEGDFKNGLLEDNTYEKIKRYGLKLKPDHRHHQQHSSHHHHHHQHNRHNSQNHKKSSKKKKKAKLTVKEQTIIMRRTLLITNIFTLLIAIACLIAAGIIDPQPLHRLGTTGAQLTLASIYVIFLSLIGLYGTRLKKPNLLLIYGYSILIVLILRSISSLISIYFFKSGTKVIFSMVLALFEVTLATLAIAVAFNLKNMQQLKPETSSIQKV